MIKSKALNNLQIIKIHDNYETPTKEFKKYCKLSKIKPKLDASGSKRLHKTPRYFTKDSLKKEWKVDFWLNPPYSQVAEFIKHAYEQHKKHNVNGIILVYSKTDTAWFHDYVWHKAELYFIRGRIKFWKDGKIVKWCKKCKKNFTHKKKKCKICNTTLTINSAPYPSMLIIYRKKRRKKLVYA